MNAVQLCRCAAAGVTGMRRAASRTSCSRLAQESHHDHAGLTCSWAQSLGRSSERCGAPGPPRSCRTGCDALGRSCPGPPLQHSTAQLLSHAELGGHISMQAQTPQQVYCPQQRAQPCLTLWLLKLPGPGIRGPLPLCTAGPSTHAPTSSCSKASSPQSPLYCDYRRYPAGASWPFTLPPRVHPPDTVCIWKALPPNQHVRRCHWAHRCGCTRRRCRAGSSWGPQKQR